MNVAGSAIIGLLAGAAMVGADSTPVGVLLGTGLCGALTTYSTLSYETAQLAERRAFVAAGANLVGSVAAGMRGDGGISAGRRSHRLIGRRCNIITVVRFGQAPSRPRRMGVVKAAGVTGLSTPAARSPADRFGRGASRPVGSGGQGRPRRLAPSVRGRRLDPTSRQGRAADPPTNVARRCPGSLHQGCLDDVVTERAAMGLFRRRSRPPSPPRIAISLPDPVEQIVMLRTMIDRLTDVVLSLCGDVRTLRVDLAVLRPQTPGTRRRCCIRRPSPRLPAVPMSSVKRPSCSGCSTSCTSNRTRCGSRSSRGRRRSRWPGPASRCRGIPASPDPQGPVSHGPCRRPARRL